MLLWKFVCPSAVHVEKEVVGSKGDVYQLTYDPIGLAGWWCTCLGFQYRHHCRHVTEAEAARCGWSAPAGKQRPSHNFTKPGGYGLCPMCSTPLVIERQDEFRTSGR